MTCSMEQTVKLLQETLLKKQEEHFSQVETNKLESII